MWVDEEPAGPPRRIVRAIRGGKTIRVPKPDLVVANGEFLRGDAWSFHQTNGWFGEHFVQPLRTADYSIRGYEDRIGVMRLRLRQACRAVAPFNHRGLLIERVELLSRLERSAVVIGATFDALHYRILTEGLHPNAVIGTYLALQARFNVPVIFAGENLLDEEWTAHFLTKAYVHLWLRDQGYGGEFVEDDI